MPPARRLRKRPEFLQVSRAGERVATRHFLLMLAPNEKPFTRLGITASKKVGNSVVRSKAKRIVREAFRTGREVFPVGFDLVVICRSSSHKLSPQQAQHEWQISSSRIKKAAKKAQEKLLSHVHQPPSSHGEQLSSRMPR